MAQSKPQLFDGDAPRGPPPPQPATPSTESGWSWISGGVPADERRRCLTTMVRAMLTGELESFQQEALKEFRVLRLRLQSEGQWDTVVLQFQLGQALRKRSAEGPQGSSSQDVLAMDEDGTVHPALGYGGAYQAAAGPPPPTPVVTRPTSTTPATTVFPQGITSLQQWGHTLIEFGKYKNQSLTYDVIAVAEPDSDMASYRTWVMGHVDKAKGQCQDLGRYLVAYEKEMGTEGIVIPGTTMVRKFGATNAIGAGPAGPRTPRQ